MAVKFLGALLLGLAGLHLVFLGDLGVVLPRVTEILEAGIVISLLCTVAVIDTGLEW